MQFNKKDLFTIPNILTYIRFLCVPFFMWVMIVFSIDKAQNAYLWAGFGLFVFASTTDIVDGYIARHFNQVSDIGKIIDPIADKVLQVIALIMLTVSGNVHWAFMLILLVKEVYMGCMTKYFMSASKKQVNQQSNVWGKVGALINFAGIVLGFLVTFSKIIKYVDIALLSVGSALAIVAAVQYTMIYAKSLSQIRASGILETLDSSGRKLPQPQTDAQTSDTQASDTKSTDTKETK